MNANTEAKTIAEVTTINGYGVQIEGIIKPGGYINYTNLNPNFGCSVRISLPQIFLGDVTPGRITHSTGNSRLEGQEGLDQALFNAALIARAANEFQVYCKQAEEMLTA